jgi:Amt family ammonium transporter
MAMAVTQIATAAAVLVLATLVWSGLISLVILKVIDATIGLRVVPEIERDSLDIQLHGKTVQ